MAEVAKETPAPAPKQSARGKRKTEEKEDVKVAAEAVAEVTSEAEAPAPKKRAVGKKGKAPTAKRSKIDTEDAAVADDAAAAVVEIPTGAEEKKAGEVTAEPGMNPDWPSRSGEIDLDRHDLAHNSSVTEWWYYNTHLTSKDGHRFSAFVCFFRNLKRRNADGSPVFASALNWAITDVDGKKYHSEVLLDAESPALIQKALKKDSLLKDKGLKKAMAEVVNKGKLPLPDKLFPEDVEPSVSDKKMDINFGLARATKAKGVYNVEARHTVQKHGLKLSFKPSKPVQRHGLDGVVGLGGDGGKMFYYFFPRCDVAGEITVGGKKYKVSGEGWYDHEFGGAEEEDSARKDCNWNWVSAQLSGGYEVTASSLFNAADNSIIEEVAILIHPDGTRRQYTDIQFTESEPWTSIKTFRDYPQKYRLVVPEAQLDLEITSDLADQEMITLIARPAFWEGRCAVAGSLGGQAVTGLSYMERNGFGGGPTRLDTFFKSVGEMVRKAVLEAYPDVLTHETARTLIATEETDHYMKGVPLDVLNETLLKPVRIISDRGGKSWRSYAALACAEVVGGDCRRIIKWLPLPEFLHVGSLIIDDIQDKSLTRRGGPCSHLVYGEALAINAGTAAYFQTQHYLSTPEGITPVELNQLYALYFGCLRGGHAGQALDIHGLDYMMADVVARGGGPLLEERVLAIHRLKTAVPAGALARMGALVGGGTPAQIEAVGMFFEAVGVAFQIMDDVLNLRGLFTEKADLKPGQQLKTLGEDIMAGKVTFPIAKAMSKLDAPGRAALWGTLVTKPQDPAVVAAIIAQLEGLGAIEECVAQADDMVEQAWRELDPLVPDSFSKMMLRAFSWFVIERRH